MNKLDFLSIGHITHDVDIKNLKIIPGGSALYSAELAYKLGKRVGIVTALGKEFAFFDILQKFEVNYVVSSYTTRFRNIYTHSHGRVQFIDSVSRKISNDIIPTEWYNPKIVLICPVAQEVSPEVINIFRNSLIGVIPQGWMRKWTNRKIIEKVKWQPDKKLLRKIDILIVSEEDIEGYEEVIDYYKHNVKIFVLTHGEQGATLFFDRQNYYIPAFKTKVVDLTGAGDVFATAFLINYYETGDPFEAAYFATCSASLIIENIGISNIPTMQEITHRLAIYKENIMKVKTMLAGSDIIA